MSKKRLDDLEKRLQPEMEQHPGYIALDAETAAIYNDPDTSEAERAEILTAAGIRASQRVKVYQGFSPDDWDQPEQELTE
jgi:hypothetical protein